VTAASTPEPLTTLSEQQLAKGALDGRMAKQGHDCKIGMSGLQQQRPRCGACRNRL
jgi:hypothetical protein